jgi:predicted kinase
MRGFSGSGKSQRAVRVAAESGAVVVSRDDLRRMMLGSYWTGSYEDEQRVSLAEESQVTALLKSGVSVVSDNTHLNPQYLRKWARLARRLGAEFEVVDVVVDVDECKRRDHARMLAGGRYVGSDVIDRQAKKCPVRRWPVVASEPFIVEPVVWSTRLPEAIIVDIDGTLAHIPAGGRSPYDYTRVHEDVVDKTVRGIVEDYQRAITWDIRHVFVVSGRDDACRAETEAWLHDNGVEFCELFMRPADAKNAWGNKLPDYVVKYELFNANIRDKYNVRFVLDDRAQVVDMWRQLGLKCLQVAVGDF